MSASTSTSLRQTLMPRSVAISHSVSSSTSLSDTLLFRIPLPLLGVVGSWLECVDLLRLFRANSSLVAAHHRKPLSSSESSTFTSSSRSDWLAAAWSHAQLTISVTSNDLRRCLSQLPARSDLAILYPLPILFPGIDINDQPAHLCRLVLAATPHLRHLLIHVDTSIYGHMAHMADTLDMTPALHSLKLSAQANDCTDLDQLYIPMPDVLMRHPRLHTLHCYGAVDFSLRDLLAIGSHSALVHIVVSGDINRGERGEAELSFKHWERYCKPCTDCTSSSVTARLEMLRYVQEECIEAHRKFKRSEEGQKIRQLIDELEQSEAASSDDGVVEAQQEESRKKRRTDSQSSHAILTDSGAPHASMSPTASKSSWAAVRLCVSSSLQACCRADATLLSRLTACLERAAQLGASSDAEFDKLSTTHLIVPSPSPSLSLSSAASDVISAADTVNEKHPAINCRWCSVVYVEWLESSLVQSAPLTTADAALVLHDASDYVRRCSDSLRQYHDRRLLDVQAWLEQHPHELLSPLSDDLLDQLEVGDIVTVVLLPGPTQCRQDESSTQPVHTAAAAEYQQAISVNEDDPTLIDGQRAELAFLRLTTRLPAEAHSADSESNEADGAHWSALQLSDNSRVHGSLMRSVVQLDARRHILHVAPLLTLQDLSDCEDGDDDGFERVDPALTQSLLPGRRVQVVGLQVTLRGVHHCELLKLQIVSVHPGRTSRSREINMIRGEWLQDEEDVRYTGELLQWPVDIMHVAPGDRVLFGPQNISRLSKK